MSRATSVACRLHSTQQSIRTPTQLNNNNENVSRRNSKRPFQKRGPIPRQISDLRSTKAAQFSCIDLRQIPAKNLRTSNLREHRDERRRTQKTTLQKKKKSQKSHTSHHHIDHHRKQQQQSRGGGISTYCSFALLHAAFAGDSAVLGESDACKLSFVDHHALDATPLPLVRDPDRKTLARFLPCFTASLDYSLRYSILSASIIPPLSPRTFSVRA